MAICMDCQPRVPYVFETARTPKEGDCPCENERQPIGQVTDHMYCTLDYAEIALGNGGTAEINGVETEYDYQYCANQVPPTIGATDTTYSWTVTGGTIVGPTDEQCILVVADDPAVDIVVELTVENAEAEPAQTVTVIREATVVC